MPERGREFRYGVVDRHRLIGHQDRFDSHGEIGRDDRHGLLDFVAQSQNVAAVLHGDGKADRGFAVDPELRLRRIDIAAPDLRDIAKAQHPSIDREVDGGNVGFGAKVPRDPHGHRLDTCLDDAGRPHRVLGPKGCEQGGTVDTEARQLLHRELDEDLFVLRAEDFDLRDVGKAQELRAHVLHIVPEFAPCEAVRREAVNDAERVAELVVEERPERSWRQGVPHVADTLANLIPRVGNLGGGSASFEIDEDRGDARCRHASEEVEMRRLLQCPLETLRHLIERVVDRGSGPNRVDHHGLDDEGRVFGPAQPVIGEDARRDGDDHEIDDHRAVVECPLRQVQARHEPDPSIRTFWSGRRAWTPAVTNTSPTSNP